MNFILCRVIDCFLARVGLSSPIPDQPVTVSGDTGSYVYDGRNRLTSCTDNKGADKSLSYDARGNVTRLGNQYFTYDMADQPRALSGAVTGTFRYDGHKRRVKAVQDGETIYNIYDASGSLVHIDNATTNEKTDYIKAAGLTLARLVNGTATTMHPDHLGAFFLSRRAGVKPVPTFTRVA